MPATARHHTPRNPARPTNGPGVRLVGAAKGRTYMPWQVRATDVALELDPDTGHYWYDIVVVTVPRQSGKTTVESDVADHRCLTKTRARVWLTMQNGQTAAAWMREEHHADLKQASAVFGTPDTPSCHYRKSLRAGEVGVKWPATSSTFYVFSPKEDALHSKQSDLVFVDEAWVHNAVAGAALRQAIRPTMNSRPGAQLWIVSTEGDDSSEYLDHYVALGVAALGKPDARVCIIDYGIPDDADATDLDVIAAHHPAYGYTLSRRSLEAARDEFIDPESGTFDESGWARAYGNRKTRTRRAAIPEAVWTAAAEPVPAMPPRAGLALDANPAGDLAALVAGWRDPDGTGHLEVIHAGRNDRALVQLVAQVCRTRRVPIVADRISPTALDILDAVAKFAPDVEVSYLSTGEVLAACAGLERALRDGTVKHPNDPDLDAAVAVATKRPVGDGGFAWGRKDSAGNIAPLNAATFALRAWDRLPAPVAKPAVRSGSR